MRMASINSFTNFCTQFEDLKYDAKQLQKHFPYKSMVVHLLGYVEGSRRRGPFALIFPPAYRGMALPKAVTNIFSSLIDLENHNNPHDYDDGEENEEEEEWWQAEEPRAQERGGKEVDEESRTSDAAEEGDSEPRRSQRRKKNVPRLDLKNGTRREGMESEERIGSIISRKGANQIRDREFDEGDSDIFLEKRTSRMARRGRKKLSVNVSSTRASRKVKSKGLQGEASSNDKEDGDDRPSAPQDKGKQRATDTPRPIQARTSQERPNSEEDYEMAMDDDELAQERRESENRRREKKRKRIIQEREEEQDVSGKKVRQTEEEEEEEEGEEEGVTLTEVQRAN